MLCGAMMVDGERDYREEKIIEEVASLIGLTSSERQASRTLGQDVMLRTLRAMDELKKAYLAKFICQVILADGHVDEREGAFVNYYFNILDLPQI